VERLWPRGIKKESLPITAWLKEAAPSDRLRRWFGHDPTKWTQFARGYRADLDPNRAAWKPILNAARKDPVILLYSARDTEHNHAVVLRDSLEARLVRRSRGGASMSAGTSVIAGAEARSR